ncbi:MAG: ATP-dependent helicase [Patescibacteria group bacterium]|nr:ATP-dependent helicase [Patescibacteria group bacterium]
MTLNSEQKQVVESTADRVLVLASAGSGKTRVLIARIAKLIKRGADPSEIVCLTYTKTAAKEIQDRVIKESSSESVLGFVGTLHSFAFKLLCQQGRKIGLPERLSVADEEQQEGMLETIMAEMGVKGSIKNIGLTLYQPNIIDCVSGSKSKEEIVGVAYHQTLRENGILDFQAMLHYFLKILKHPQLEWPYRHLLLDEFQDSADMDWAIYDAMPCKTKLVVGDGDQILFSFRGSNSEIINGLSLHPDWTRYTLSTNYRCRQKICDAANNLIKNNLNRFPKETVAKEEGGVVVVERCEIPGQEMGLVADELCANHHDFTVPRNGNNDCAVLARTNRIANEFSDFLKKMGIPVAEKKRVTMPADWRKAKLLLTVLSNPHSDFAVHQYLVESIGRKRADMQKLNAELHMVSLNQQLNNRFEMTLDSSILMDENISPESRQRIHDATRKLSELGEWTIPELILFINSQEDIAEETGTGIHVGTIHGFKGREASTVYLVGFEDELIPGERKGKSIEEERRIAFVGLTRAKKRVVITWCAARHAPFGPQVMREHHPSRFINEMGLGNNL